MLRKSGIVRDMERKAKLSRFYCLHFVFEVGIAGEMNKEDVAT